MPVACRTISQQFQPSAPAAKFTSFKPLGKELTATVVQNKGADVAFIRAQQGGPNAGALLLIGAAVFLVAIAFVVIPFLHDFFKDLSFKKQVSKDKKEIRNMMLEDSQRELEKIEKKKPPANSGLAK